MIELLVALVVIAIALVLGGIGIGRLSAADTRASAAKVATAIRYTYHLSAVNNKVYALMLDLDNGTFHAAPVQQAGECDRLLLRLDGKDSDGPLVTKAGDMGGDDDDKDDEDEGGDFGAVVAGTDGGPPEGIDVDTSASARLKRMIGAGAKAAAREEAERAGVQTDPDEDDADAAKSNKKLKTFAKNLLAEPVKFPDDVKLVGVIVRDGGEPVTSGVVPILVYPHGYAQRALIYVESTKGSPPESFTVEVLSLQARGVIHEGKLDGNRFKEEVE